MKQKLAILTMMVAVALGCWSAMAFYNPQVTQAYMDIVGFTDSPDGAEQSPGDVVALGKRKEIKCWVNEAGRASLSWASTKIKVYDSASGGPALTPPVEYDATTTPRSFFVEGVAVSSGLAAETLLFEALHTTPYPHDIVAFTVIDVQIRTKPKGAAAWDSAGTVTEIAAGGLGTAVYQADVEVEVLPAGIVSSTRPLTICLTISGGGYMPTSDQQWWWPTDVHKRALLSIGSFTNEFDVSTAPISFTSLSGSVAGTLRSSNKVEPTAIRAECGGAFVQKVVSFGAGTFVFVAPSTVSPYTWTAMSVTRKFAGQSLEGHRVKIVAKKVEQTDGTIVKAVYRTSLSASYVLESFVWIGSHPSADYYTGQGVFDEVTIGSDGSAASQYNVRGFQKNVEIEAVDLNTAEYISSVPPEFAEYMPTP